MAAKSGDLVDGFADRVKERVAEQPFQRDTEFISRLLPLMELFGKYFDSEVNGLDQLPADGPFLLVGNHSGGMIVPDTPALLAAWHRARGVESPLVGLAFDGMFGIPGVETLMRKIGQIPASHENAAKALASGASVLVYPGGAHEAFRPWYDRNVIDFNGHRGYVKLALRTGVPVVPVVGHGGQHTLIVLSRGEAIAKRFGLERLRLGIAPLLFQLPWGVSLPGQIGLPLPAKITVEVGAPIDWSHLSPEAAEDPAIVEGCHAEVTELMQRTLDRLSRECPYPLVDRLLRLLPGSDRKRAGSGRLEADAC